MSLIRLSPQVQRIQATSPYVDIYTNAPASPLRSRPAEQHLALLLPHAHPEPKRWENPGGWGARHMNDKAPFNLWNAQTRTYRSLMQNELKWVQDNFGDGDIHLSGWCMCIETANPPQPVPLTVGCMPVKFTGIGESESEPIPRSSYTNPRLPDPCPATRWPSMTFPTFEQNFALLSALQTIASVRAVIYMPNWTIVELEYGDGRVYEPKSLPGTVAGRATLYHHAESPFYDSMKSMTRERRIDPARYLTTGLGPMPQDDQNYFRDASYLSPGCRLECGHGVPGSQKEGMNAATSAGIKLRRFDGQEVLTASHHGFLVSPEVYHPYASEDKIGDVIDTRPELDIALVKLNASAAGKFTNTCYFQAETPRMILKGSQMESGCWFEVDGMSSGLVSLLRYGVTFRQPPRPAGHPAIEFRKWKAHSIDAMFGAVNNTICEGMCGAPIVQCETGGVGGFFHLSDGVNCFAAHLDDLVAEGWQLA